MPSELAVQRVDPLVILQSAVDKGADIATLQALMELAEKYQANQGKVAFREAMAQFKLNAPKIEKNKHVKAGQMEYDHATLDRVTEAINDGLSKVGITHSFKIKQEGPSITVICVLSKGVHSELTALTASADTSGSKNSVQAIGSTVTYLQRYTLLSACGLATGVSDNDGAGDTRIAADVVQERIAIIEAAATVDTLKAAYGEAYRIAQKANDKRAMSAYIEAKDKRRAEIEGAA